MSFSRLAACAGLLASLFGLTACASHGPSYSADVFSEYRGEGTPTVLFISGNGSDSSGWTDLAEEVRALGHATVRYDRPGLGQSALWEGEYRFALEEAALLKALDQEEAQGPFLIVAHSYGGLVAAAVSDDIETSGIVLVDALIPGELTMEAVEDTWSIYRPQYDAVREAAPELAAAVIPVVEAFGETAAAAAALSYPEGVPIIDIRAETPAPGSPEVLAAAAEKHRAFVAEAPGRRLVLAEGSGHNVPKDRPDVVLAAIRDLLP
jgi:pimeloyl-ACP methyl ester carboxylesterase